MTINGVLKLACFCDIFNLLNELNLSLQGKMTTLFKLADKVAAFNDKFKYWKQRVNKGVFDMFQILAETLEDSAPEHAFSDLVYIYKSSSAIFQALKTLELQ